MPENPSTRAAPSRERLKWGIPGIGLEALGLDSTRELFAPGAALSDRTRVLEEAPRRRLVAFPLPGTPDARGNLTGSPGPLGTGWLWLTAFRGGMAELVRARCTHPRSESLAEREWNLLCHLRAHGIGTPEPILVGARGAGPVATRSFLLVRAPEGAFPLPRWLRTDGIEPERERGLLALGRMLALLRGSGVELPGLRLEHVWMTPSGSGQCESGAQEGLRKNKLPGVSIVAVRGGRMRADAAAKIPDAFFGALAGVCSGRACAEVRRLALAER